ncbi:MAG: hypothetical protein ABH843_01795 [Candidatus Omnitrophota bacterium]
MKKEGQARKKSRIVAFLTRDEIDFIDKLSKDALFSTGRKLSRTEIIRAFIDVVKRKDLSAEGVRSKSELEQRLLILMKNTFSQTAYDLKRQRCDNESR